MESDAIDRLVRVARASGAGARLSPAARARILQAATSGLQEPMAPLRGLFAPAGRLALAAALPLALAAVLLVAGRGSAPERAGTARPAARLEVSKQGEQVVIRIANGQRDHTLYRSTTPDHFDAGAGIRVKDGAFVDRLDDSSSLVFYRID